VDHSVKPTERLVDLIDKLAERVGIAYICLVVVHLRPGLSHRCQVLPYLAVLQQPVVRGLDLL
jgi:hypothetical protein